MGDKLRCLDAVNHQPQFVGFKLWLCDVVPPSACIIHHRDGKIVPQPYNIVIDGFDRCFDVMEGKKLLDSVCVLGMLLCGVMI